MNKPVFIILLYCVLTVLSGTALGKDEFTRVIFPKGISISVPSGWEDHSSIGILRYTKVNKNGSKYVNKSSYPYPFTNGQQILVKIKKSKGPGQDQAAIVIIAELSNNVDLKRKQRELKIAMDSSISKSGGKRMWGKDGGVFKIKVNGQLAILLKAIRKRTSEPVVQVKAYSLYYQKVAVHLTFAYKLEEERRWAPVLNKVLHSLKVR